MNLRTWPRRSVVNDFHNSRGKLNKTSGVDPRFLNLLKNCICKENSPNQHLVYSTRFYLLNQNGFSPNLQMRNVL